MADERASVLGASQPFVLPDEETQARLEVENGLRQFDRVLQLIEEGVAGRFRLRPSQMLTLNRLAVEGLVEKPGSFRLNSIEIFGSKHQPPECIHVPELVDELCEYVNDHWVDRTPLHLASYVMWRVNWIHPFEDGNGRTSRAASYLVLCVKLGFRLPGARTIPERIVGNKFPYYAALDAADAAWRRGALDVSKMESLLADHLASQLVDIITAAGGKKSLR